MAANKNKDTKAEDSIGSRLIECRKKLKYTQQRAANEIATESGSSLTRAAYAQWETTATTPDVSRIRAAAKVFATSPAYLAFGERSASVGDVSEIVWIRGLEGGHSDDCWAFPSSWVYRRGVADIHLRVVCAPYGDVDLGFQTNSTLLVNIGIRAVGQPGIYVLSSGDQISLAAMALKGSSNTEIAVKAGPVSYDVKSDAVDVRGRVIGCWSEL